MTRAVLFDVDFTLIYPGPTFGGEGYRRFCERHGIVVDVAAFEQAIASAAPLLDDQPDPLYDAEIFVRYVRHVIGQMGGTGDRVDACAREVYAEWAVCRHFELYDDVRVTLQELAAAGLRVGLISNSHRCLESFQTHFELRGLVAGGVSSSEHGMMKPHPSIFQQALSVVDVRAEDAVMVGDSVRQDVEGALRVGMRAILVNRTGRTHPEESALARAGVPTVQTLGEVPALVESLLAGRPAHPATANQVQMDVEHGLPRVTVGVEHRSKAPH
jgi:putative hydrolase of the HAD superfamily